MTRKKPLYRVGRIQHQARNEGYLIVGNGLSVGELAKGRVFYEFSEMNSNGFWEEDKFKSVNISYEERPLLDKGNTKNCYVIKELHFGRAEGFWGSIQHVVSGMNLEQIVQHCRELVKKEREKQIQDYKGYNWCELVIEPDGEDE